MPQTHLPHDHGSKSQELLASIPAAENFQIVSELFRQLGDSNRIRIFWILCHLEECVINISAMMEMSSPAVSHHLRQLKSSGLIVSHRDGKEMYYKAADTEKARLLHSIIEQMIDIACPASI